MGAHLLSVIPAEKRTRREVGHQVVDGVRRKVYFVWRLMDVQLYKTAHTADLRKSHGSNDR